MYQKDTVISVRLKPGDAEMLKFLRDEGFNPSALCRKAIRKQYAETKHAKETITLLSPDVRAAREALESC